MGVINRVLSGNRPTLYFVCRTYQRFTKNSACTCHCVRVERVTDLVTNRIREICLEYLDGQAKEQAAKTLIDEMAVSDKAEEEIKRLTTEVNGLTAKMDRLYDDRLNDIVEDFDFTRRYNLMKEARISAQKRLEMLTDKEDEEPFFDQDIDELAQQFIASAGTNRELLCSLIDKVEMSQDKKILIRYRFAPEEIINLQ